MFFKDLNVTPMWWGVICSVPLLSGLTGRMIRQTPGFEDFDAVTCAGITLLNGGNPYSLTPDCTGLRTAAFVYAPPVVEAVAYMINLFGADMYRLLIGGLWLCAALGLGAYALKFALPDVDIRWKLPMFALFTGGTIACGNVAILLHGLVLLGALSLPHRVWPFLSAVVMVSVIKPVLLTYLIVLVYVDQPSRWRITTFIGGAVAGLSLNLWVLNTPFPLSPLWKATLDYIVLNEQTGISYFGWLKGWDVPSTSPFSLALLPLVLAGLSLAGLAIAELSHLKAHERLVLGLGTAQLLNPRLMDYDLLLIIPYVTLLICLISRWGGNWPKIMSGALISLTGSILLLNAIDQRVLLPVPLSVHLISLATLALGGIQAHRHWPQVVARSRRAGLTLIGRPLSLPAAE